VPGIEPAMIGMASCRGGSESDHGRTLGLELPKRERSSSLAENTFQV
jgi:hypothetical protein